MPEELHECFSVYSVVVDGDIDDDTYSIDFLNSSTPSGVPLHILLLKRRCCCNAVEKPLSESWFDKWKSSGHQKHFPTSSQC